MLRETTLAASAALLIATPTAAQFPPLYVPSGNPITPHKVMLGKALFFEEQASSTNRIACATCHAFGLGGGSDHRSTDPDSVHPGFDNRFGTADDIRGSKGVVRQDASGSYVPHPSFRFASQVTRRRSMSVINAAYGQFLFWDGRAIDAFRDPQNPSHVLLPRYAGLETQAAAPFVNDVEMSHLGEDWTGVLARIRTARPLALATNVPAPLASFIARRSYPDLFQLAFGSPSITAARVAMALATYERTLISDGAPYDAFLLGNNQALTASQLRGLGIFNSSCDSCHSGPLLSNHRFENTGVRPPAEDLGHQLATNNPVDRGRFRVPSLRNVSLRAPYFHNGRQATLMDVVEFYNRGGDFNDNKNPRIRPLGLSAVQRQDLVNFLMALTDPRVASETAPFDRPTLFTETRRRPELVGSGTAGTGGKPPQMIAIEPPFLGNPNFTLALKDGMGGALAFLLLDVDASTTAIPFGGASIHLPISPGMIVYQAGPLRGLGPGNGYLSRSLTVPHAPSLVGAKVGAQWVTRDAGGARQFTATQAARITLF